LGAGDDTVWAVVLGAVLATLGGFVATQLEGYFRRRERERGSALLFGELLTVIALLLKMADESRSRGEPYGPLTMRLLRGVQRETETYDRNRESLYDLRDGTLRARIHTLMVRITLTIEGVFEAHDALALLKSAGDPIDADAKVRAAAMDASRQGSFDFLIETSSQLAPLVAVLQPLSKQPIGDHEAIARAF